MDSGTGQSSSETNIEEWERDLVRLVAARIRTTDREELTAELHRHLLQVKRRHRRRAKYWKAYLRTALENKAKNWIRDREQDNAIMVSGDTETDLDEEESASLFDRSAGPESGPDTRAAWAMAWQALGPELQTFYEVLDEETGNLTRAALRLRMHRNTARNWKCKILKILAAHGL
jgi:DNA-directed RNA polymerase specialized sigma24 family protein